MPRVATLEEVTKCLEQIEWTQDKTDYIQTPEYTWFRKKGDCEDFSALACRLLEQMDPDFFGKGYILTVLLDPPDRSHAVCAFWSCGILRYYDNSRLKGAGSLREIVEILRGRDKIKAWSLEKERTLKSVIHRR